MLLVLLGTHHQPFNRLLKAVDALDPALERVVQTGHTLEPLQHGRAVSFLPFEEVRSLIGQAEAVITHAGTGSIMMALAAGKTPVVAPRLKQFGEHVDDHQREVTENLAATGQIIPWLPGDDLADCLARAAASTARRSPGPSATLINWLNKEIQSA